jgi:glycosyltransferase involved in cell wall biosynthesis
MKYYKDKYGYEEGDFPNAELIGASTITLPLYPKLTKEQVNFVTETTLSVTKAASFAQELRRGVSLFFPSYNEEGNVQDVVKNALAAFEGKGIPFELIIVNDGSKDKTGQIAERLAKKHKEVKVFHHNPNQGYGAALQTGFTNAKFPYVGYMDGDGQFDAADFVNKLLPQLATADLVTGKRVHRADPAIRKLNAYLWNILAKVLFQMKINDVDCGMKVIKREVLQKLHLKYNYATICQELHFKTQDMGYVTKQVPVIHKPRLVGVQTGANPFVILNSLVQLFQMRLEMWVDKYWKGDILSSLKSLPRIVRFGLVGAVCFFIQLGVLTLLVELYSISPLVANIPAFTVATGINFFLSWRITWNDRREGLSARNSLTRFFVLGVINEGFFAAFNATVSYKPALILAVLLTTGVNYLLYSKFVFPAKITAFKRADA